MRNIKIIFISVTAVILLAIGVFIWQQVSSDANENQAQTDNSSTSGKEKAEDDNEDLPPLTIKSLRSQEYIGGDFVIEETLPNSANYRRFVASYKSEGLKINGLLTVPISPEPEGGFPAVLFVHGYIPPKQYSTVDSYPTYQARLARAGLVTFKPDLRGHNNSEGEPVSAHYSDKYIIDTLNALAYLKNHESVNSERIGYWGHSNGGNIGLRSVLASSDIKSASFWSGVVGSYEDMFEVYIDEISFLSQNENPLIEEYGLPSENSEMWDKLDPYAHLGDINIPIQLQHGVADSSVPVELSRHLKQELEKAGKTVEYFEYQGDDHNISQNADTAWQRTISFFEENL